MKEKEKLIEELKQFPMLAQITDADMEDLLLLLKREDFPEGSRIIEENEEGDCMYLQLQIVGLQCFQAKISGHFVRNIRRQAAVC